MTEYITHETYQDGELVETRLIPYEPDPVLQAEWDNAVEWRALATQPVSRAAEWEALAEDLGITEAEGPDHRLIYVILALNAILTVLLRFV